MKSKLEMFAMAGAVALSVSGAALAEQPEMRSPSRAEVVQAELAEANRLGTIVNGDGTLWRDLGAPRTAADRVAGPTREQVQAELAEANRAGTILSGDGTLWRDLGMPSVFTAGVARKTREQVQAELAEANRAGTILSGDGTLWRDLGMPQRLTAPSFARN